MGGLAFKLTVMVRGSWDSARRDLVHHSSNCRRACFGLEIHARDQYGRDYRGLFSLRLKLRSMLEYLRRTTDGVVNQSFPVALLLVNQARGSRWRRVTFHGGSHRFLFGCASISARSVAYGLGA